MKISSWVDFHLSNTQAWVRNSTPPQILITLGLLGALRQTASIPVWNGQQTKLKYNDQQLCDTFESQFTTRFHSIYCATRRPTGSFVPCDHSPWGFVDQASTSARTRPGQDVEYKIDKSAWFGNLSAYAKDPFYFFCRLWRRQSNAALTY